MKNLLFKQPKTPIQAGASENAKHKRELILKLDDATLKAAQQAKTALLDFANRAKPAHIVALATNIFPNDTPLAAVSRLHAAIERLQDDAVRVLQQAMDEREEKLALKHKYTSAVFAYSRGLNDQLAALNKRIAQFNKTGGLSESPEVVRKLLATSGYQLADLLRVHPPKKTLEQLKAARDVVIAAQGQIKAFHATDIPDQAFLDSIPKNHIESTKNIRSSRSTLSAAL